MTVTKKHLFSKVFILAKFDIKSGLVIIYIKCLIINVNDR